MSVAVEVQGLAKRYGNVRAVDGITFSVAECEVFGLLGHNGAGKTTTIRMLTGRARPTAGTATVAGYDIVHQRDHIRRARRVVRAAVRHPGVTALSTRIMTPTDT